MQRGLSVLPIQYGPFASPWATFILNIIQLFALSCWGAISYYPRGLIMGEGNSSDLKIGWHRGQGQSIWTICIPLRLSCSENFFTNLYIVLVGATRRLMSRVHNCTCACEFTSGIFPGFASHVLVLSVGECRILSSAPSSNLRGCDQPRPHRSPSKWKGRSRECKKERAPQPLAPLLPVDTSTTIAALLILSLRHLFCALLSMHCLIKDCTRPENNTVSWLQEFCRQVEAEVYSRKKLNQFPLRRHFLFFILWLYKL